MCIKEELKKKKLRKKIENVLKSQNIILNDIIENDEIIYKKELIRNWNVFNVNEERIKIIAEDIMENNLNINSYLDFGCNDGIQSDLLSNILKIKRKNYYGIDIKESCKSEKINFLKYNEHNKIPLNDNKLDLVTCLMSLHHVDNIFHYLREIYRVLNKGGILFVRESNITNYEDFVFNNVIDNIYTKILNNENEECLINFRSIESWITLFIYIGFKVIKIKKVEDYNCFLPYHLILKK